MSDHLEQVLLTDVPDFADHWLLKSTPCGGLIHQSDVNPRDPTKMIVFAKGQDNAEKIANTLDGYNLYGSIIKARYAFIKPPEASEVVTSRSTPGANCYQQLGNLEGDGLQQIMMPTNKPARVKDGNENLRQDRKRLSSAVVVAAKTLEQDESPGSPFKTSSRGSTRRKDSQQSRESLPDSKQAGNSSTRKSQRCRFCRQSSHETWFCKSNAEYYQVGLTVIGRNPTGSQWPESCIVQVEGLCAGPIIEYIEKFHLQMEELNREEIRIMFAWLTNYYVCHTCGAAGHMENDGLCKYLPLKHPETEEMMAHIRRPFCRRMMGIRDKVSFGKLQKYAKAANSKFRAWMEMKDGRPFNSDRREEEHSERPQRDHYAESGNEELDRPGRFGSIVFVPDEKRIKVEQRHDC